MSVFARLFAAVSAGVSAQRQRTDGTGPSCYSVQARLDGKEGNDSLLSGVPLTGVPPPGGALEQPLVHAYGFSEPYFPADGETWGWLNGAGTDWFNFVEQHQFVLPYDAASSEMIYLTISPQDCDMPEPSLAVKYRALWLGGLAEVWPHGSLNGDGQLAVNYTKYIDAQRRRGDPIYVTFIPCTDVENEDPYWCRMFDPSRAIAVMVSFRQFMPVDTAPNIPEDVDPMCKDAEGEAGYDCCVVSKSIGPDVQQADIDDSVNLWTSPNGKQPAMKSCLQKPSWQCYWNDDGNVRMIQYKGSLVDFMAEASGRKDGQGLRIILQDRVTVNLPLTTTYLEYSVDPAFPDSCNSLCGESSRPSDDDIRNSDGSCKVNAVSSFAQVNGGKISVGGFGRIDGLPFHARKNHYFDEWSPGYDGSVDWAPGAACPLCNRFCPLTPYAWGMHALSVSCNDPLTERTSSLRSELGDALYHIDSALLEISSNAADGFAVDIADVTVSNMLKRGDAGVMIQSPGHFVRSETCLTGSLDEWTSQRCSGPNMPAKSYGLKYMGGWHDAVDGPALKSEGSMMLFTYLHNADDALKPYSNSVIRDSTVIHGGVGGVLTPCTYNLQSYSAGCRDTRTVNTHVVRIMDPTAGYEATYHRGGVVATRFCAGKTSLLWRENSSIFENNVVDGLVVNSLGDGANEINELGRVVAITVTPPSDGDGEIYFCPTYYEPHHVHLKQNAFVMMNVLVEPSTYRFDWTDGGGSALVSTEFADDLATVDTGAVDLSGLVQRLTDPDGYECGFSGWYTPCDTSSMDDWSVASQCYVMLDSQHTWQTFEATGLICDQWQAPMSVVCKSSQGAGKCAGWAVLPWGENAPSFDPFVTPPSFKLESLDIPQAISV